MYYPLNDRAIFVLCSKEFTGFKLFKIFIKNYFKSNQEIIFRSLNLRKVMMIKYTL